MFLDGKALGIGAAGLRVIPATFVMLTLSAPAFAQELPASENTNAAVAAVAQTDAPPDNGTADIIVTAERRSQRLQDVPISITAVTGAALETAGVVNTSQLAEVTPGLVLPGSLSGNAAFTPFLRGVGSSTAVPGIDATVALYIDGVYQASKYLNQIDLANIERVEVLKGPQGTLYGRNATGGAINIITRRPTDKFQGNASVSYGNLDETEEKLYISGPIAAGLNASIGVVAHQGGDYGRNQTTGNKFGGLNSVTVNGRVAWDPTDRLAVDLTGTYARRRGRRFDDSTIFADDTVPPGGQFGGQFSTDPDEAFLDTDPRLNSHSYAGALHLRYSLENVDLVSISSYKEGSYNSQLDSDGTSLPILTIRFTAPSRAITQELQAVSTGTSSFQWILGAYYIDSKEDYDPFGVVVDPVPVAYFSKTRAKAGSVFGQGTYEVAEGTKLTAGLRYSTEKRSIDATLVAPTLGNLVIGGPLDLDKTFNKLTWRLSVDHKVSRNMLVYASYNRGFKSGAFNPLSVAPDAMAANPEVLDAYEVGLKSQFAERTIQVNAAGYYYKYKNIQVQQVLLGSGVNVAVLRNAAKATFYGLDADFVLIPLRNLRLNGGFNLEHAEYDSFEDADGFIVANGAGIPTPIDQTGKRVFGAPALTFNAAASYEHDLGQLGSLLFAANYSYISRLKTAAGEGNFNRGHGILNAAIAFTDESDRYSLELYGRNLTNVRTYGEYTTALANSLATRPPRTYGISLGVKF